MEPTETSAESVDEVYRVMFMELTVVAGELSGTPEIALVFPGGVR